MHQHLAVLGSPIAHSKSPRIHAAAYAALDLPWHYEALECTETELGPLLDSRGEGWRGFSVTMPLKEEAHRLSAVLDPVAAESGVVNTLLRLAGSAGWAGFNTDVAGLAAAINDLGLDAQHTVVLGAGATAVSAVLAARSLGAETVTIFARRPEVARRLVDRFGSKNGPLLRSRSLSDAGRGEDQPTLIISTLPGPAGHGLALPERFAAVPLFDVAYDPWPSPLSARHCAGGGVSHSGIGMLLHQALIQVRIFVTGDPAVPLDREAAVFEAMRATVV